MKVLKRGLPPEEKVYTVSCVHCRSEIEFQAKEARVRSDQRDGTYLVITCPVCSHTIYKNI